MTDNNKNLIDNLTLVSKGDPLFNEGPFEVYTLEGQNGYGVLNKDTGVWEVVDTVLGKCITFVLHAADFLEEVDKEKNKSSGLEVYAADALTKVKAH